MRPIQIRRLLARHFAQRLSGDDYRIVRRLAFYGSRNQLLDLWGQVESLMLTETGGASILMAEPAAADGERPLLEWLSRVGLWMWEHREEILKFVLAIVGLFV